MILVSTIRVERVDYVIDTDSESQAENIVVNSIDTEFKHLTLEVVSSSMVSQSIDSIRKIKPDELHNLRQEDWMTMISQ